MLAIEVDFSIGHLADNTRELFFGHGHLTGCFLCLSVAATRALVAGT